MSDERVRSGYSIEIQRVLRNIDAIVPELSKSSIANQLIDALNFIGFKELLQKCQRKVILVNSGTPSDEAKLYVSEVKVKPSTESLVVVTEVSILTTKKEMD